MGFNLGGMSFETNQWTTKLRDFSSGPEVADEPLLWVKTRIHQFAHTIHSYGNGPLLVRLPVIRLSPRCFPPALAILLMVVTIGCR
jgi:hypothetical protein